MGPNRLASILTSGMPPAGQCTGRRMQRLHPSLQRLAVELEGAPAGLDLALRKRFGCVRMFIICSFRLREGATGFDPRISSLAARVNRRAYDTSDSPPSYRVPDARVGNFAFDVSLEAKKPSKDQIRGFFNADFKPIGVVIVRPNQLGDNSSYIIWRTDGD